MSPGPLFCGYVRYIVGLDGLGEDNDVVFVVAGLAIKLAATGNQSQPTS